MELMGGLGCESCGRPMMSDQDHGGGHQDNRYCRHCTDAAGTLRSYDEVWRTLVEREFMGTNGMPRAQAEVAARNALAQTPVWRGHR